MAVVPTSTGSSSARPGSATVTGRLVSTGLGLTTDARHLVHRATHGVAGGLWSAVGPVQRAVSDLLLSFVPGVASAILDQLDLTAIVRERVDLDALVAEVDVVAVAREVLDAIDLPQIVRESTGAMASETVLGVRMRTVDADERVTRAVNRLMRRPAMGTTDHAD